MALTITSYTPTTGSAAGGTTVTFTGTQLDTVDLVTLGNTVCTIVSQTTTSLVAKTPATAAAGGSLTFHLIDNDLNVDVAAATPFVVTALPTGGEKLVSTNARKWKLQIDTSAAQDGTSYIDVRAVQDFAAPLADTLTDDSTYDDGGWTSQARTGLTWNATVKLARKQGITSKAYDLGQETLRASSKQFGTGGLVRVRWFDRNGGPEAYEGFAFVSWSDDGGATTALATVTCTLAGNGARTDITNPAAA